MHKCACLDIVLSVQAHPNMCCRAAAYGDAERRNASAEAIAANQAAKCAVHTEAAELEKLLNEVSFVLC